MFIWSTSDLGDLLTVQVRVARKRYSVFARCSILSDSHLQYILRILRYFTIYTYWYNCMKRLHIALQLHDIMHDVLLAIQIHFSRALVEVPFFFAGPSPGSKQFGTPRPSLGAALTVYKDHIYMTI